MKKIRLGGVKLASGVFVKPYEINVYDGNLYEMPQKAKHEFYKQMFAAAHVPTDYDGIMKLGSRIAQETKNIKDGDYTNLNNIHLNLLNGLHQNFTEFSCKSHAFYCLIEGVTQFDTEFAKAKMKMLYTHGLNEFNTYDICEDVKKKLMQDYSEISLAYTQALNSIGKSMP